MTMSSEQLEREDSATEDTPTTEWMWMHLIWRRKALLALGVVVGVLLGGLYYVMAAPIIRSNAKVLVVNKTSAPVTGTNSSIQADMEDYISTQQTVIRSPAVVEKAISNHGLTTLGTYEQWQVANASSGYSFTDFIIDNLAANRARNSPATPTCLS